MFNLNMKGFLFVSLFLVSNLVQAQREWLLKQVDLPHAYYYRELYVPQLTSGASFLSWSPDGTQLVYSMKGSLWIQNVNSDTATQITDDDGYDHQPDWSPDGNFVLFTRYNGEGYELMLYNFADKKSFQLTTGNAVNLEPRWSPDGKRIAFISTLKTGHFLLHVADVKDNHLENIECITPDRKSETKRYYYSAYDHAINPVWSRDGKKIFFISNHEISHGTGDLVSMDVNSKEIKTIQHEETNWRARPDISPDGTRVVYASYHGRNYHQLWLLPSEGGYPFPITYGDYDNMNPRWSPDGKKIAFISNRSGNTSLWMIDVFDGKQQHLHATTLNYLRPHKKYSFNVLDENGNQISARVSIIDTKEKFYAPDDAWIHGDDSRYPGSAKCEAHYFHTNGNETIDLPNDMITVQMWHGFEHKILKTKVDLPGSKNLTGITLKLEKLNLPSDFGSWRSGDLHVHMNYGGYYRNSPERLADQADAENLNYVFNLIVNKEQRVPDVNYFSTTPFQKSGRVLISHGQEFHTSFWGHMGLLRLNNHLILPDYVGYPNTAAESLFPNNSFVADRAHEQKATVGYVHPFDWSDILPEQSPMLFSELPVDAALGKVDYYEVIGFAEHRASEAVWYHMLNCGFKLPAGAGTDAMGNYASLRGPLGLNRVFVKQQGALDEEDFLSKMKKGKSFISNGPMIGFIVDGKTSGDSIQLKNKTVNYTAFVRSPVPVDHFEIVWNGKVIAKHVLTGDRTAADVKGTLKLSGTGWVLLRVWNDKGHPDIFDLYPFASTNPIFVIGKEKNPNQKSSAEFFLKWVNRLEFKTHELPFRTKEEQAKVLEDIAHAKRFYEGLLK